jgi:hypothetical protein
MIMEGVLEEERVRGEMSKENMEARCKESET